VILLVVTEARRFFISRLPRLQCCGQFAGYNASASRLFVGSAVESALSLFIDSHWVISICPYSIGLNFGRRVSVTEDALYEPRKGQAAEPPSGRRGARCVQDYFSFVRIFMDSVTAAAASLHGPLALGNRYCVGHLVLDYFPNTDPLPLRLRALLHRVLDPRVEEQAVEPVGNDWRRRIHASLQLAVALDRSGLPWVFIRTCI